ncbi:MAG: PSD1 and planctomycete cytochrome C domain-containing protein [Pirellulaceae bacterium]
MHRRPSTVRWLFASLLALLMSQTPGSAGQAESKIDFARDVRPILSNYCFKCHGNDEETREAGLRLDTAEGAQADLGGYQAIKPREPATSALIERITETDPDLRMPPADSGLVLSAGQIETLRAWIEQGADYQQHWAFRPIVRPAIPVSKPTSAAFEGGARSPLDAFILRRLSEAGLAPSPPADRATLIRRVHLDLLGLPPSPAQVEAFLADESPAAYERMVDRALASPRFGEKWGRHWLDQARYADTNGYTIDSARTMWPYRDWVIDALNRDLPFDRFTIEQLAGDLLPEASQRQLVATGFHRNTLINQEGGTDREQFRNEAVVDRVNTTGAVWMGLTVGCAQCHTHKYDPLTQHEYYQLFAFFNSSQDVNSAAPTVSVASDSQNVRLAEFDRRIAEAKAALAEFDRKRDGQRPAEERSDGKPIAWQVADLESFESAGGATFEKLGDGSLVVGGKNADSDVYAITFASPTARITALRLETLTHPSLPKGGPGRAGNGNFVLNDVAADVGDASAAWVHATADHSQKDYDVRGAIDDDPKTGWAIGGTSRANVSRTAVFITQPLATVEKANVEVRLTYGPSPAGYNIGRLRLSVTDAPHAKFQLPDPERERLAAALKKLQEERAAFAKSIPAAMVMRDLPTPRQTHVLIRGDFLRQGDAVKPDAPAFLPAMPESAAAAEDASTDESIRTRLDLARWLVSGEHPLTARVTVNRVWMRLFGQGLVETENDFGLQGTPPTHPQLLDWLSAEYMRSGWSTKHLLRRIVCSATYRQSSAARPDAQQVDPLNKLLARQSRVRVSAEIVRDLALAASGLLSGEIGGPSVYPPQPDGVYAFTQRRAAWPTSKGADRYRRGMYTFFMRSAPHPMLTTFDSPAFNTTCTRRPRSNTPLQSLTMANDEALFEAAQALASRLVAADDDDPQRIEHAYRLCFARLPSEREAASLLEFLKQQRADLQASPEDAQAISGVADKDPARVVERAAWTVAARVLLNLDEFITRE